MQWCRCIGRQFSAWLVDLTPWIHPDVAKLKESLTRADNRYVDLNFGRELCRRSVPGVCVI
jgi:hypothetical protein